MEENKSVENPAERKNRRNHKQETGIHDPRSASRQQFTKINMSDPREKLSELHIKAQKERRQKNLIDKRAENKKEKEETKDQNSNKNQLLTMIKEMSRSLSEFEQATRKEIDNIMEMVKIKFNIMDKEQEKLSMITKKLEENYDTAKRLISNSDEILNKNTYHRKDDNIKNSFIHNQRRYRWGLAMLRSEENKYTRVPLIPLYKYYKHEHKWKMEYFVRYKEETIKYTDFYEKNKHQIVMGKRNIIETTKIHKQQKERSMKLYRERMIRKIYERIDRDSI